MSIGNAAILEIEPRAAAHSCKWYLLMELNHADAVHSRAPYHRIGLAGVLVPRARADRACRAYGARVLTGGRGILAAPPGIEPGSSRFNGDRDPRPGASKWHLLPVLPRLPRGEGAGS